MATAQRPRLTPRRILAALTLLPLATAWGGCGAIPFQDRPASGYAYGSTAPLRIAIVDETGGNDWSPAIAAGVARYAAATPHLQVNAARVDANITVTFRRYHDARPPLLHGYVFQPGVGGFAAVYDAEGRACNFPPSAIPLDCSGEITSAQIYLNDIIPSGPEIEARRLRLVLHELGHALGLTRHSPDLEIETLARRYGWGP